jgi:hypothetical protein
MNTQTERKTWHSVDIKGRWRLSYKVGNSQGPSAFGGYHLPIYPNPFTGQRTYLKTVDGTAKNGYMIDKLVIDLYPEQNRNDYYIVSWLICHPEVKVKGVEDLDPHIISKKDARKITLTYRDKEMLSGVDDEDFIDVLLGKLSLNSGKQSIGLKRLRHIMAQLGQAYMDPNFEGEAEKKMLRTRLKNYVKKSIVNAKIVDKIINNPEDAKMHWEFKEMIRLKILTYQDGVYKFHSATVGSNFDTVRAFFMNHPDVHTEALTRLYALTD